LYFIKSKGAQSELRKAKNAVETLGLLSKSSKEDVRKRYLELSKQYHPDGTEGDPERFAQIHEAYKIVMEYIEHFRYFFDEEECKTQFPLGAKKGDWLYG